MPRLDLTTELAAPTGVWPRTLRLDELGELSTSNLLAWIRAANQGDHDAYLLLAEEMEERDPHYASVLSTRKRALLGLERKVESASDKRADKKLADAVRALIATPAFAALLPALLDEPSQLTVIGTRVAAATGQRVMVAGRGPGLEPPVTGEGLSNQRGSDHLTVVGEQGAVSLVLQP